MLAASAVLWLRRRHGKEQFDDAVVMLGNQAPVGADLKPTEPVQGSPFQFTNATCSAACCQQSAEYSCRGGCICGGAS